MAEQPKGRVFIYRRRPNGKPVKLFPKMSFERPLYIKALLEEKLSTTLKPLLKSEIRDLVPGQRAYVQVSPGSDGVAYEYGVIPVSEWVGETAEVPQLEKKRKAAFKKPATPMEEAFSRVTDALLSREASSEDLLGKPTTESTPSSEVQLAILDDTRTILQELTNRTRRAQGVLDQIFTLLTEETPDLRMIRGGVSQVRAILS